MKILFYFKILILSKVVPIHLSTWIPSLFITIVSLLCAKIKHEVGLSVFRDDFIIMENGTSYSDTPCPDMVS